MTLVPKTELEALIAAKRISLSELLTQLVQPEHGGEQVPPPPTPTVIPISDEQIELLHKLPELLAAIELPDRPRTLTAEERDAWVPLFDQIKKAKSALEVAEAAFKTVFGSAIDAEAQAAARKGRYQLSYDKHGHVLTTGEIISDHYDKKVTRELRGGNSVELTMADLHRLEEAGLITHKQLLAMTVPVPATRRPDEDRIVEQAANPKLREALAQVARLTPVTSSVQMRPNR
jgi:hypothetical protein